MNPIVSLRKYAVLRFTPEYLNIISATPNEPQVFCKLSNEIFDVYEVQSIRDNTLSFEINVEQLYQVLKQYEKSNADQLAIRLQKKENQVGKRIASLALFFNDSTSTLNTVNHTFSIVVRLLRKDSDERIVEPELSNVDIMIKLPDDISSLFKRIERYKNSDFITVKGTNQGALSLNVKKEDNLNITVSWNELLKIQSELDDSNQTEEHEVMVRSKDWKLGSRICEVCKNMVLIMSREEALVFHCFLDESEICQIIYFINAVKP